MQCVNGSASRTSWTDQLGEPAGRTSWTDQPDGPAGQTSWTDQLDGPAGRTSWTDQLDRPVLLFEALASSHIRRFSFQFVHCRSFRVRRRPCFIKSAKLLVVLKHPSFSKEDWTYCLTTVIGVSLGFADILISSMFVIEEGNRLFISADGVNKILFQANRFQVLQDPNFLQVIFSRSWFGPRELLGVLQQLSKETFVQGTVVQADFSPRRLLSKL